MDKSLTKIFIKDLSLECKIGVTELERRKKQPVLINIVLYADVKRAGETDDISETVNYEDVSLEVVEYVKKTSFCLLEKLAEEIAEKCLEQTRVEKVEVRIEKPRALKFAESAGVEIIREKT